jgi:hypothetical protein
VGIVVMAVGAALFAFGVWKWHLRWAIEDTPTSDAAHVFPGRNEIHGVVEAVGEPIVSPLSGRAFVRWNYTLEKRVQRGKNTSWDDVEAGGAWTACWLRDRSGRVRLDPDGARISGDVDTTWSDGFFGEGLPQGDAPSCARSQRPTARTEAASWTISSATTLRPRRCRTCAAPSG